LGRGGGVDTLRCCAFILMSKSSRITSGELSQPQFSYISMLMSESLRIMCFELSQPLFYYIKKSNAFLPVATVASRASLERGEIQADVRQQGPDFTGWASESVCLSLLWSLPLGLVILRRVPGASV
jgi:hypothetical protein